MTGKIIRLLLLCGFMSGVLSDISTAAPDRVPTVVYDDFETGEMHAWESYPYAQDIGYEPFTIPKREPTHNKSKFALTKIHRPNDAVEVHLGFTKQFDLWTSNDTRLKVALFLTSDRKPDDLELSLCLFDGRRFFYTIQSPDVNRWLELDVPLVRFIMDGKRLGSGEHIQAVTILARYSIASHIPTYNITMDDFSLSGERQRRFIPVSPTATTFEEYWYSILNKHYFYGDSVDITVKPEDAPGNSPVKSVTCSLVDPSGKTVVSGKKLKERDGVWTINKAYTFTKKDPRGQWTINFKGEDESGSDIEWGFRFLMPGPRLTPTEHPRLFFTGDEIRKRIASQSSREQKMLDDILRNPDYFKNLDLSGMKEVFDTSTEALTGHAFSKPRGGNWRRAMSSLTSVIESGALLYAFTGDETAGLKAREALIKLCAFTKWNHPWQEAQGNHIYYPVGYIIGPIGIGYDLLHPLLSEADKKHVRDGLMRNGIKQFHRDMVEMNRMPSSVTNHISVIVSNLAIAATAIYGEDPDNPSLEPYMSGILAKMKLFIDRTYYPDGSYGEPIGYENMATRDLVEALYVLERNFGIDYTSTTNIKEIYRYPLHGAYSNGRMPDFGDTGVFGGWGWGGNPFLWLTYRMKNPWTAHYVLPTLQQGRGSLYKYLWYTEGLETKQREELIPSYHFPCKGTMFLRSGWSDEGSILVFKSGPNSNHYHVDQGSMILVTNGEKLLSEAGLERFKGYHAYYANLYFPAYTTQPVGHNCMLIDGDPESQLPADYENGVVALRNYPTIPHSFAGWDFDEVEGDLTCVYKGKLLEYKRSILFVKPDIYILYDKVRSNEGHSFDWLFHADDIDGKPSISYKEGYHIEIVRPKARLNMHILSPDIVSMNVKAAVTDEHFIQLTSADGLKSADFLAVMSPTAITSSETDVKKMASSLINTHSWKGAKVETGDTVTRVYFRKESSKGNLVDGFTTDAERFAVMTKSDDIEGYFLRGALFKNGSVSFVSSVPVSSSVVFKPEGTDIEIETSKETDITVSLANSPQDVTVNGKSVKGWKYDDASNALTISLPMGHSIVKTR